MAAECERLPPLQEGYGPAMQVSDHPGEVVGIQKEPEEDHIQQRTKEENTGKHGVELQRSYRPEQWYQRIIGS